MNIKQNLMVQFERPQGRLGQIAGIIMARRSSNQERNFWTLSLLDLQPTDRVLEIGFGPGIAIRRATETVTRGIIVGIDHSEVMVSQARRRNARAIADRRVVLVLGSVAAVTELHGPFDKIFSSNVAQFWHDPVAVFQSLSRLMTPTGVMATTFEPRGSGVTDQDTINEGNRIARCLKDAGFKHIRLEFRPMKPVSVVCVLAKKEEIVV